MGEGFTESLSCLGLTQTDHLPASAFQHSAIAGVITTSRVAFRPEPHCVLSVHSLICHPHLNGSSSGTQCSVMLAARQGLAGPFPILAGIEAVMSLMVAKAGNQGRGGEHGKELKNGFGLSERGPQCADWALLPSQEDAR